MLSPDTEKRLLMNVWSGNYCSCHSSVLSLCLEKLQPLILRKWWIISKMTALVNFPWNTIKV